jgi:hypothetical protein
VNACPVFKWYVNCQKGQNCGKIRPAGWTAVESSRPSKTGGQTIYDKLSVLKICLPQEAVNKAVWQEVCPAVNLLRKLTKTSMEKAIRFYDKRPKTRPVNSVNKWKAGKASPLTRKIFIFFLTYLYTKRSTTKKP